MATLIKTDGTSRNVIPANGADFSAEEIHELIDGFFEFVYCKDGIILAVDEEGKLKNKDFNLAATHYAMTHCNYPFNDILVGDALLLNPGEVN